MKRMYVLYDGACGVCCRAVARLAWEPSYIQLRFAPAGSMVAQTKFAEALAGDTGRQVVVVADTGEVYRGASAWIMVLYALKRWRPLAMRLATPTWRPWVERAIDFIGRHRHQMSGFFGIDPHRAILNSVRADAASGDGAPCANGACGAPLNASSEPPNPPTHALLAARARARLVDWRADAPPTEPEFRRCES